MPKPSDALLELENLFGLVTHHRQICHDPDCLIPIDHARLTAARLASRVEDGETEAARESCGCGRYETSRQRPEALSGSTIASTCNTSTTCSKIDTIRLTDEDTGTLETARIFLAKRLGSKSL